MSLITVVLGEGGGARVCSAAVLKWMVMGFLQLGTKQEGWIIPSISGNVLIFT
jgi:hypothetical protein